MTLRARMSMAFVFAALIPLGILAYGIRRELTRRVAEQHARRVSTIVDIVRQDVARESASIAARLEILSADLAVDDGFRLGAVRGDAAHQRYVLDWAPRAMELAGLSMLRVYDDSDRVVSSGHFRNEFGRPHGGLPGRIASAPEGRALVRARTPASSMLALASVEDVRVGGRRFTIVGGTAVDELFFARLGRTGEVNVSLALEETGVPSSRALEKLPFIVVGDSSSPTGTAHLAVVSRGNELDALRHDVDRWIAASVLAAGIAAATLVVWLAAALSRPMATLANAVLSIDFHTPAVDAVSARDDEVGTVARRFAAMTRRLRASAVRLREAERRATVGEMARQVNHDVKNGLVPIRNVLRHLSQVYEASPQELSVVFGERRATLDSSVTYLDELATRWARLTPPAERRSVDVNAIVRERVAAARDAYPAAFTLRLSAGAPAVFGDPIVLRRILDNLVANAAQSLDGGAGAVTVTTEHSADVVRITIADTGCGMSKDELARALAGFYTTKPHGTGLGLSVVRRLLADQGGYLRIETAPQRGTVAIVELPVHATIVHRGAPHRS